MAGDPELQVDQHGHVILSEIDVDRIARRVLEYIRPDVLYRGCPQCMTRKQNSAGETCTFCKGVGYVPERNRRE